MTESIAVCAVSADQSLIDDLADALSRLSATPPPSPANDAHEHTLAQLSQSVAAYWARPDAPARPTWRLCVFPTLEAALAGLPALAAECSVEWLLLDADLSPSAARQTLDALSAALHASARPPRLTPASWLLYLPEQPRHGLDGHLRGNLQVRRRGLPRAARRADLLRLLMDHLEHAHGNRLLARALGAAGVSRVARTVTAWMRSRWGEAWDVHYYTGSMVAALIDGFQRELGAQAATRCLDGCHEHALAAAALAGWQCYGRAYVLVVTSGMVDEFRGTLANLARAGAPGLIICAESPTGAWFAFQGARNSEEDNFAVLSARGLAHAFVDRPAALDAQLAGLFAELDARPQPAWLFATQAVLEARADGEPPCAPPKLAAAPRQEGCGDSVLAAVLEVINHADAPLLWQCGAFGPQARAQVARLAQRTGAALVDSLTRPGSVCAYEHGQPQPAYLGTLAMYGFSRRVHALINPEDDATPAPWLFCLASRLDQAATPFSEGRLLRQQRIVQVTHCAKHLAPFADLALAMPVETFLDAVEAHLAVAPQVLARRQAWLARVQQVDEFTPADYIATRPMTANYFFASLNALLHRLIRQRGWRYLGVYDVGRGGLSAVRNLPRTGPGFSGWYGRALMGDALMALPYLAGVSTEPVLAFIGDGARAMAPAVEMRLLQALARNPHGRDIAVCVFYLNNGVLSLIQTYLDKRLARDGRQQLSLPPQAPPPAAEHGACRLRYVRLDDFNPAVLEAALCAGGQVTVFDAPMIHNSDGDGLSLLSETAWTRRLPPAGPAPREPS